MPWSALRVRRAAVPIRSGHGAMQIADAAFVGARSAAHGASGEVRIGCVSAAPYEHLRRCLARLRQTLPDIRPTRLELSAREQREALADGPMFGRGPAPVCTQREIHAADREDARRTRLRG